jgi:hypothetical protein
MLAPRNQTSRFCRSNIELGERGALFLSNCTGNYSSCPIVSGKDCLGGDQWCFELVIKRFSSKFIASNNIYYSNKAYVGKILGVLDTIHSFRGEGLFLTRYIPMQLRMLL